MYKRNQKTDKMFRGYDHSELCEWLGADPEHEEERMLLEARTTLAKLREDPMNPNNQHLILGIRTFLTKLSNWDNTHNTPLWKGLLAIDDDWTFLRFVDVLLEYMWD